jgi:septum formation protein
MITLFSYHLVLALTFGGFCVSAFSAFPVSPHACSPIPTSQDSLPQANFGRQLFSTRLNMTADKKAMNKLLIVSLREKFGESGTALAKLVLASQSPRRREILDMMGLSGKYTVQPSPLDESLLQAELRRENTSPTEYTRRLAEEKAHASAKTHIDSNSDAALPTFFLGSDTIVELDDCILEKPEHPNEAKEMLRRLSGRQHHVQTGVAVYRLYKSEISLISSFTDTASVTFADLSDEDIDAYVASGEPMDKAGKCCIDLLVFKLATA